ncbi:hypothetical protein DKX38_021188 [Salix brachista]|uniref:Uncharacterized protein n=1 Tax=Salix brachista TaxID=2182728 RepID=A0A5N5K754_9ROSI|nr:hypothetical protein DKX38_021188 [Salix brachista]
MSSSSLVIIFVVMVLLAALDSWILVALRWWDEQASSGDQISTESKYDAVLTSLVVLKFMLIGKMVTYYCDHQNHSDAKKQIQGFASQANASHFTSTTLGAV